jgi:formylglycine-generating enzyme required for sulfatase activity
MLRSARGCIDRTEVTQKQYAEFLAAGVVASQPPECAFNTTFVPGQLAAGIACSPSLYDPIGRPDAPVRCVDWCDAYAFCSWAGKRLCRAIGGGVLAFAQYADPSKSEWMVACGGDPPRDYPYGVVYTPGACHADPDAGSLDPFPVATAPSCVGSVSGLFDMSGNVAEWEDACDADAGKDDVCRIRGGGNLSSPSALACAGNGSGPRGAMGTLTGFRCCAP